MERDLPASGPLAAPRRPPGAFRRAHPLLAELAFEQLPIICGVFALAVLASYLQGGGLPGAGRPFAVAGVRVPIWHLVWMGFWTGYIMGLVGEASGIFSMPYSMSVLHFASVAVSPTTLITTFINPIGALLGYRRNRQWNLDLALWLCIGAVLGSPIGPFIRVYWLTDPIPFKAAIGLALFVMAVHLWVQITPWYLRRTVRQRQFKEQFDRLAAAAAARGTAPSGLPADFRIETLERSLSRVRIGYMGQELSLNNWLLLAIGFGVGIVASALGVGGGFMLVPIMVTVFGLPMYVLVAATVPYVIVLSVTGLIAYVVTIPQLTGRYTAPDWAFGLFVASGAVAGAWLASKTQRYVPERYLKPLLGTVTGIVGLLYLVNYFYRLPFAV